MARIAYITTGKFGIHSFTHNEICELDKDHEIFLCLTQLNLGLYMPEKDWTTIVASKKKLIIPFMKKMVADPGLFIHLFNFAKKHNVIPFLLISFYFFEQLKHKKINSIHCQMGGHKLFIGYFLKQLMNVPLTVTIHAHELYQRDLYEISGKFRDIYNACDKIITISDFNKNILVDDIGISKDKIEVMRLFPEMKRVGKFINKKKILIVANWVEKKGFGNLFEAVEKLNRKDFVLMVVGGTSNSENSMHLDNLIKEKGLEEKILLLGQFGGTLLDVVYSSCDIFCLPSITEYHANGLPSDREGIPVALMEAMAWGKPVISTLHAGIPELVEQILIKENDVNGLIDALNYLLDHPEKWNELGKRNQEIVHDKYHSRNVKQLSNIFKDLLVRH